MFQLHNIDDPIFRLSKWPFTCERETTSSVSHKGLNHYEVYLPRFTIPKFALHRLPFLGNQIFSFMKDIRIAMHILKFERYLKSIQSLMITTIGPILLCYELLTKIEKPEL